MNLTRKKQGAVLAFYEHRTLCFMLLNIQTNLNLRPNLLLYTIHLSTRIPRKKMKKCFGYKIGSGGIMVLNLLPDQFKGFTYFVVHNIF